MSPLVAELYRWWYRKRQLRPNRLLIQSFMLLEPWWTLRLGAAPFWMKFQMEPSYEAVERYLDHSEPYDDLRLMLMAHGVECVGLPPIDDWRKLLGRAPRVGAFVGVDEEAYPRDFATFGRYHNALKKIPARYPMPGSLTEGQLDEFLAEQGERFPVEFTDARA